MEQKHYQVKLEVYPQKAGKNETHFLDFYDTDEHRARRRVVESFLDRGLFTKSLEVLEDGCPC